MLTHNLSDKKLGGKRFGLIVPMAYKRFNREATKEDMDRAHVLGKRYLHICRL